ncbi:hypothetical protein BLA24_04960 [Streptomyces cinnamoneus]|uniref:Esterase n=1 Tax=Streptomyces cinnamoneus TaxID=53446 RepID=A0A2G1XP26_STRCJ|nr:alpha/beta hydrolase-fold protein [Streptomyces cinnamoneus]PHQ52909.1 hypothetical protein BLA24_04960 [Streptomyces cinnamoneus]PPT11431.1 hypothetical protein CYQ11_28570 [Streptomyces cinnamoneus]
MPGPGSRKKRWIVPVVALVALGLLGWPILHYLGVFSDKGDPVSFAQANKGGGKQGGGADGQAGGQSGEESRTLMPTGPEAKFTVESTLGDGTKIAKTKYQGQKSGFTGNVWVWAPKEYYEKQYEKSGFPVLIALPGGDGAQTNYWIGGDLALQANISTWVKEGKSLPFVVVMPTLNPNRKFYYDGSDIPDQPKMGTWLTEDVPDLVKANFRTLKSRDGWAFMGSSSGGFAGLKAVLKHPDKFKAVIASGPDIVPDSPLWKGHEQEKAENNPKVLAQRLIDAKGPDVYLAFQYGTAEDPLTISQVDQFRSQYDKGPVHTMLKKIPGGKHNARTYVPGLGQGPMEWISKQMEGPTPAPAS